MARFVVGVPLIVFLAALAFTQNPPQNDPQAVSLVTQAMTALTGGGSVNDVTLNGNASWIAGSDNEVGTATLLAKGTSESRIDLNLSAGTRTEIRNDTGVSHQGESIAPNGTVQPWAEHNCQINASWFFPALSALGAMSDSSLIYQYMGLESRGSGTAEQYGSTVTCPAKKPP